MDPRVAFVALGSNLDEPRVHVLRALAELSELPQTRCTGHSSLYSSAPLGPVDQPAFVNAVARLETQLEPRELLDALLGIERTHGRSRDGARWGPRTLDLDLLLYGERQIDEPGLTVPHPGLTARAFVLYPLAELAPGLAIPGAGPLHTLLSQVDPGGLTAIED
ncbi:MAG: 2-amino-4-hydroxy-6-hydroxymethyldihydropteridine diphosphokinase [Xanthomonadaceae bacterium]|nr:2-amino-4-hydroxy-6-hydroxymethyldihydropteridine diphosphokinase [Xanthomonadaceae bacterium]